VLSRIDRQSTVLRCDYRGTFVSELPLKMLPPDFSKLTFRRLEYQKGSLYLVDPSALKIVVTDEDGNFQNGYDLRDRIQTDENPLGALEIDGFNIDSESNMLFTIPVLFAAYVLSPDGELTSFGVPGSGPGRFNLAAGIVADERGYLYVADRLKSVVQVFSNNFKFLMQFGYRGLRSDNLVGPKQLAIDSRNRLYVSQLRERGISVFQIHYPEP
jgi:hypothetical protein